MAHVYILRCVDGTLYTGSTRNIELRIAQHQAGLGSEYTKRRLPVYMIWNMEFERVEEAFQMEKRIQGWGHRKRETLIYGGVEALKGWSRKEKLRNSEVE